MTGLVVRALVLVVVVVGAFWFVGVGERRRGRGRGGFPPGLVLVTGAECTLCEPAKRALRAAGAEPRTIDIADLDRETLAVSALPVALIVGSDGEILMRRSGRSVISDAPRLAGAVAPAG